MVTGMMESLITTANVMRSVRTCGRDVTTSGTTTTAALNQCAQSAKLTYRHKPTHHAFLIKSRSI